MLYTLWSLGISICASWKHLLTTIKYFSKQGGGGGKPAKSNNNNKKLSNKILWSQIWNITENKFW
jgi:hypothetical protein